METSSSNDGSDLSYQTLSDTKEYTGLVECNSFELEAFLEPQFGALPHASLETAMVPPGLKPPPGLLPPPGLGAWGTPEGIYLGLEPGAVDGVPTEKLTHCLQTTSDERASTSPTLTWPDCESSYQSKLIGGVCYVLPIC